MARRGGRRPPGTAPALSRAAALICLAIRVSSLLDRRPIDGGSPHRCPPRRSGGPPPSPSRASPPHRVRALVPVPPLAAQQYGRGAEVWPPTNENLIRLEDSFPGGAVPASAAALLSREAAAPAPSAEAGEGSPPSPDGTAPPAPSDSRKRRKRRAVRAAVSRILRGAAASERTDVAGRRAPSVSEAFWDAPVDWSPAAVAAALLLGGLVRPTDAMSVAAVTGYAAMLGLIASSPDASTDRPAMPSLPPRGHVPSLVSNPLGVVATNSGAYRLWLRTGAVLGLICPLAAVLWYFFGPGGRDAAAASAAARPVFLLCCQAVSEASSRRLLAPLPLRIFIPVAYSAMRLAPLWDWALAPIPLGSAGRILAVFNLIYWSANLFGFLLPVAAVRYMRAHFFCVEAREVTLREGGEGAAGLLP